MADHAEVDAVADGEYIAAREWDVVVHILRRAIERRLAVDPASSRRLSAPAGSVQTEA